MSAAAASAINILAKNLDTVAQFLYSASSAGAGAATGAGKFATAVGGIKVAALLAVVTNLEEIGKALGEGVARWQGYGKALEDAERQQKAEADATRLAAEQKAALAQQTQIAAGRALELGNEARALGPVNANEAHRRSARN